MVFVRNVGSPSDGGRGSGRVCIPSILAYGIADNASVMAFRGLSIGVGTEREHEFIGDAAGISACRFLL